MFNDSNGFVEIDDEDSTNISVSRRKWMFGIVLISATVATSGLVFTKQTGSFQSALDTLSRQSISSFDSLTRSATTGTDYTIVPSNLNASKGAISLLDALHNLMAVDVLGFGHQYANFFGQEWVWYTSWQVYDQSDVKNATGDYPLIFGYDLQNYLNGLQAEENDVTDDARTYELANYAVWAAQKGAVIEFSWLANNPAFPEVADSYNTSCDGYALLADLLPGKPLNSIWVKWLDHLTDFFNEMKYEDGSKVPFIFRPFHEMTEFWYWWGTDCNTKDEFLAAWNYTRWYLEVEKGNNQILWMYAPSKPSDLPEEFEDYYPGDDQVDIISWDRYSVNTTYSSYIKADCAKVVNMAKNHNKVATLAETGIWQGIQHEQNSDWFMTDFLNPIIEECPQLAYAMTYTNFYHQSEYFVPVKGQKTYSGFLDFHDSVHSVFLGDELWTATGYSEDMTARTMIRRN